MNIAILTTFKEFNPGYSLTGIVKDQCEMLTRHGNIVYLYVNEKFHGDFPEMDNVVLCKDVPDTDLIDYLAQCDLTDEHLAVAQKFRDKLIADFVDLDINCCFTHDLIFTGWNMPYALGIQMIGDALPCVGWLHWVHSIPSGSRDWWVIGEYGPKHRIIYPNKTDVMRVAEAFCGEYDSVRCIPHIKDLRTFFDFKPETRSIINLFPGLMSASFVQIYPAGTDRLDAKRVDVVIQLFGYIKSMGHTVMLLIANQWATGRQRKQDIEKYYGIAKSCGLIPGKEFAFTSDIKIAEKNDEHIYETGVPMPILRELMMCSSIFFFPTREESFGLVLPEVALASGAFCVLNRSLKMQIEVSNGAAIYFDFGAFDSVFQHDNMTGYLWSVASISIGRFQQNESIMNKTMIRQRYNMDNLYLKHYLPVIAEIESI